MTHFLKRAPIRAVTDARRRPRAPLLALALLLLLPESALALSARALVDRNAVGPDDMVRLTVVVSGGGGEVDTSPIQDFDVASRGSSTSVQIVNTHMSRKVRYQYALSPRRTGTLTIPALTVRSGSESARTAPITVQVAPRGSVAEGSSDLQVKAAVSTPTPYLGQEIIYTFSLERTVQLLQASYQEPSFEGFTVTKLKDQTSRTEVRNGQEVQVTEITYLLTPQQAGALTIGPAVLACQVPGSGRRGGRRTPFGSDPFGGLMNDPFFGGPEPVEKTLRTAPVQVTVRPLPPAPAGTTFSGLVGTFSLTAAVDPGSLPAGGSATVTLTLEGAGNLAEAAPPELAPPPGAKVYPDTAQDAITRDPRGTRGKRTFRYALVPTKPGKVRLGPFRLTAFDPAAGGYRPLEAGPLDLTVTPGEQSPEPPPVAAARPGALRKQEVLRTGHDILSVRPDLDALTSRRGMGPGTFVLWLALPAFLCGAVRLLAGRRRRTPTIGERLIHRAEGLLREARADAGATEGEFSAPLRRALVAAVLARAGREGEALTDEEVRHHLAEAGAAEAAERVVALLHRLDAARYGGEAVDREELLDQVAGQVRELTRGVR